MTLRSAFLDIVIFHSKSSILNSFYCYSVNYSGTRPDVVGISSDKKYQDGPRRLHELVSSTRDSQDWSDLPTSSHELLGAVPEKYSVDSVWEVVFFFPFLFCFLWPFKKCSCDLIGSPSDLALIFGKLYVIERPSGVEGYRWRGTHVCIRRLSLAGWQLWLPFDMVTTCKPTSSPLIVQEGKLFRHDLFDKWKGRDEVEIDQSNWRSRQRAWTSGESDPFLGLSWPCISLHARKGCLLKWGTDKVSTLRVPHWPLEHLRPV